MIKPAGYRVLLKMQEVQTVSAGGIHLAPQTVEADKAAQKWGEVVAVGPDAYREYSTPWCQPGDVVSIARYAGDVVIDPATREEFRTVNDLDIQTVRRLS